MVRDVSEWLERLKLGQYAKTFADNDVDRDLLLELNEDDLVKLGVTSLGHRKRLFKEIAALKARERPETPAGPPQEPESAERRQLTVMFCDLVGSTELSGRLDPEDLRDVLRRYQNAVTTAVTRYGGHVGQYLGDGVLAYFGWPHAYEDQAERAIWAALDSIENVKQVTLDGNAHLNARVGVASGPVVIGEFVDYSGQDVQAVTGKTPNLAARLQGLATPGQIVIDANTRRLIGTAFRLKDGGRQDLKGFAKPVPVWHVTGRGEAESRFAAAHSGGLSRLVGRDREMAVLGKCWSQAKAGTGRAVLLSGEAGIGKSRIVQAFCASIAEESCLQLSCQCSPLHTNSTFHPIIRFLERLAEFGPEDDDRTRLDKLEALLGRASMPVEIGGPLIATLLSIPGEERYGALDLSPQQVRDRTIELLVELLVDLGRRRPVVFQLEDAHWIDPTTETLIGEAVKAIADAPILMLITHRPEYLPQWSESAHVARVDLHKLPRKQGAELVRVSGGDALAEDVVVEILARADGVPLFIEELTKSLLESDEAEIPASLQASLVARLDRLGDAAKVAQLAALLGRSFHYRFIRAVSDLGEAELDRALTAMTESDLLSQTGTPPRAVYAFRHALIQDAAYETLLKSRRARYHGRVADVLLDEFPDQASTEPELVARHLSLAAQPKRAVGFWLLAGQRARERSAHVEAIAHLEKGLGELRLLDRSATRDEQEFSIRTALGASLAASRGWSSPAVEENYQRAHEISEAGRDMRKSLLAQGGLANVYMLKGEIGKARALAEQEVSFALDQDDMPLLLRGYRFVGMCSFLAGDFAPARESLLRGMAMYDTSVRNTHKVDYSSDPAVVGHSVVAWISWFLGEADQARQNVRIALALAEERQHPFSLAYARSLAASIHQVCREPEAVRDNAEAAIGLAEEHDYPYWLGWSTVMRGWALSALGQHDDGIEALQRGLDIYQGTGARQIRPYILTLLAQMLGWSGAPGKGLEALAGAYGPGNETDVRFYEAEALRIQGELLRQSKDGDGSEQFRSALALARRQGARALELRTAISVVRASAADDRAAAYAVLAEIQAAFDTVAGDPDQQDACRLLESFDAG